MSGCVLFFGDLVVHGTFFSGNAADAIDQSAVVPCGLTAAADGHFAGRGCGMDPHLLYLWGPRGVCVCVFRMYICLCIIDHIPQLPVHTPLINGTAISH